LKNIKLFLFIPNLFKEIYVNLSHYLKLLK
jgi:hypothetical protein